MLKRLLIVFYLMAGSPAIAADGPDSAIHEELRSLLRGIERAINDEKYDDLAPYFHENLRVTTINQEVIGARPEIGKYFRKWFGSGGYLKKLHIALNADALTELYGDKTFGIVRGSGDEDYLLADGRSFGLKTRWTATMLRDTDGKWRILTLHIGTNFLDNPILNKAESALTYFTAGGLAAGMLIGGLIVFVIGRRKKRASPT